ncbi:pyridoxamine 5'-phosphate oxidase family protein [Natronoglomus mannanivorans]|uniref:Pyridoxamine 5'-phosphate oxidase family protein n=1 Tax=Natronoglomus mannanivorans TaxID=2979990 RepID=A0AAP2YYH5_9EURY|nr:pyridoxamine 5'-phosphate oxidase family protein [Halobacteria archaeon AArc-xg1-1]
MSVDELQDYGLVEMNDDEIHTFLSTRKMGVLGLPEEGPPYLLPMSYGYDGDRRLYFTYLLGSRSRKATSSEAADTASFLVFQVDTMYTWESVRMTGTITAVPETEWDELKEIANGAWRPEIFESATLSGDVTVYEFRIDEWTGIKHQGLPPEFDTNT